MKEGNYYRWSYQQHIINKRHDSVIAGTLYWCCARIAIFKNGRLRDIYWSSLQDGRSWSPEEAEKELVLTFLDNENNLVETTCPQFYEKDDVIDIRHPNMMRGGIYIRRGAKRSKSVMKNLIDQKIDNREYEIRQALNDIERLKGKAKEIETADLEHFWI